MATELQKAANRKNAAKSTGPRTTAGKEASRRNALRHGLTAKLAGLPSDDTIRFHEARNAMFCTLKPKSTDETQLVERIVNLTWRLRLIPGAEMAALEQLCGVRTRTAHSEQIKRKHGCQNTDYAVGADNRMLLATTLDVGSLDKFSRYETSLSRELRSSFDELRTILGSPRTGTHGPSGKNIRS